MSKKRVDEKRLIKVTAPKHPPKPSEHNQHLSRDLPVRSSLGEGRSQSLKNSSGQSAFFNVSPLPSSTWPAMRLLPGASKLSESVLVRSTGPALALSSRFNQRAKGCSGRVATSLLYV